MEETTEERVRLTISVPPQVHAAFTRLAEATGGSIGREMGDFLAETVEAVEFTAEKVEQAREAPHLAMREMHAYALGLADETGAILERVRQARAPAGGKRSAPAGDLSPPPSNTGGKVPQDGGSKRRPVRGPAKGRR